MTAWKAIIGQFFKQWKVWTMPVKNMFHRKHQRRAGHTNNPDIDRIPFPLFNKQPADKNKIRREKKIA